MGYEVSQIIEYQHGLMSRDFKCDCPGCGALSADRGGWGVLLKGCQESWENFPDGSILASGSEPGLY